MTSQELEPAQTPKIDLTNCDREPIHLLGNVQGYGCLISTSADMLINHMSVNCKDLLKLDPDLFVGKEITGLLPRETIHDLRARLQVCAATAGTSRLFSYDVLKNGELFDISIHLSGQSFVFEFEPKTTLPDRDDMAMVQPLIARVTRSKTLLDAAKTAARAMRAMSEFDRVMVYRFAADGSGEVIAEDRAPDMEPFLGLRYPESDIPKQARELYTRSLLRLIADVNGTVSPLVPPKNPNGEMLDLSLSVTRAVSEIHLEYLRNMGVGASMSVSILKDGKLWGLFACHHRTARYVDYERRTAIELFAQFFSYELAQKDEAEKREGGRRSRELHDRLMVRLSAGSDLIDNLEALADELGNIVGCDGVAVFSDGRYKANGSTPTSEEFRGLSRFLNTAPVAEIFATSNLSSVYPTASLFRNRVAGLIAVPISRTPRDYIVFCRREIARSVKWAGNPQKPVEPGPNGARLTPRKSFEAWTEVMRGTSEPWSEAELQAAEALRISLIEIVLKLSDEANQQRKKAEEKQALLIAELNHRVRNILNLIKGLISQGKSDANDIASYAKDLDGRVLALANAHDQLTRKEWAPTSLRELIAVEAKAYLNKRPDRIEITGDKPMLVPEAVSTLALVMHELMTNSAKYGALCDNSGKVRIDLTIEADGALMIQWQDRGGPAVQAPTRRGFGTTIIELSVPSELNGTVETRFKALGYEADIVIPSRYVTADVAGDTQANQESDTDDSSDDPRLSGEVLVLEDSLVIALYASDILMDGGASNVVTSSSVRDALEILSSQNVSFALLDVNLGNETSLPVADYLREHGIPFVFGTGYGDHSEIMGQYPDAIVVQKPFSTEGLLSAAARAIRNQE